MIKANVCIYNIINIIIVLKSLHFQSLERVDALDQSKDTKINKDYPLNEENKEKTVGNKMEESSSGQQRSIDPALKTLSRTRCLQDRSMGC